MQRSFVIILGFWWYSLAVLEWLLVVYHYNSNVCNSKWVLNSWYSPEFACLVGYVCAERQLELISDSLQNVSFIVSVCHRRWSSVNFRGKDILPEKYVWKINKMPEFYMILSWKLTNYPNFYNNLPEIIIKFSNFTWFLPEKCQNFTQLLPAKNFPFFFWGGGHFYAYGVCRCILLQSGDIIRPFHVMRFCSSIFQVWVKKSPLRFSDIFPKRLGIFSLNFTYLLFVPIYVGLQIFIQLSAILTKLCRIICAITQHEFQLMMDVLSI